MKPRRNTLRPKGKIAKQRKPKRGGGAQGLSADQSKEINWLSEHGDEYRAKLLCNIKEKLPQLEELLTQVENHWGMEDGVYRFYHQSFKVYYRLQPLTE
jgi:hypothetical protein